MQIRVGILAAIISWAACSVGADPLVARADLKAKAGEAQAAASLYRSWLQVNGRAPGAPVVFSRYFSIERDVTALLAAGEEFLNSGEGPGAGQQLIRIAQLFELAGRVEKARDAYARAFDATGSEACLASAVLLSIEMNDTQFLQARLGTPPSNPGSARQLLDALAAARADGDAAARSSLADLAEGPGDPDVSLKALWSLYAAAASRGDAGQQEDARRKLADRYPGSPEARLASKVPEGKSNGAPAPANVVLYPLPEAPGPDTTQSSATAGPGAAAPPPPGPSASAAVPATDAPAASSPPASVTFRIQAGAFQMKENADDLARDLQRKGFSPSVVTDSTEAAPRYRVFAGTGMDLDQARNVLAKLGQDGFAGFLVAEK